MNQIYFATNRNMLTETPGSFGARFNPDKPTYFRVGKANVPKAGKTGYRVDPASVQVFAQDPGQNGKDMVLGSHKAFTDIRATLAKKDNARDIILYIHGFATGFNESLERASQLCDAYLSPANMGGRNLSSKKTGPRKPLVFCFSWPSDGTSFGNGISNNHKPPKWAYFSDRDDAKSSGVAMARSLSKLFTFLDKLDPGELCNQRIHLVAHSMGAYALRHALQALKSELGGGRLLRILENVFLMAADEDADALNHEYKLKPLIELARQVHVYHAHNDTVLAVSDWTKSNPDRLGENGPIKLSDTINRVISIDCADVAFTRLRDAHHQYYRLSPKVINDVRAVLRGERHDRIKGRAVVEQGRSYRIKKEK